MSHVDIETRAHRDRRHNPKPEKRGSRRDTVSNVKYGLLAVLSG
jgi:hypothetical protein